MRDILRKYIEIIFIGLSMLLVTCFTMFFVYPSVIPNYCQLDNLNKTNITEVVYSKSKTNNDCFGNLNSKGFVDNKKNIRVSCDLYMVLPEVKYSNNLIGYNGQALENNQCLISKNLAIKSDLQVNDKLFLEGSDCSYVIVGLLYNHSGIDNKYKHDGSVILPFNKENFEKYNLNYVNFTTSEQIYLDVDNEIFISNEKTIVAKALSIDFLIIIGILISYIALIEVLFQRKRYLNCYFLMKYGAPRFLLFNETFIDVFLKYILPVFISVLINIPFLGYYGMHFWIPGLIILGIISLISVLIMIMNILRGIKWKTHF